ncbi:hypothetical protein WH367_24300 [Comamonas sp. MYb21]|uniref:hypothetical protein n=1 Tax=Comamonas sp. MYb21 TaxID=1848648 RepID=UPI0030AD5248
MLLKVEIIARSIVIFVLPILLLAGCEKYALDKQMELLCKKDAGVIIYEQVELPSSRFDAFGKLEHYRQNGNFDSTLVYGPEFRFISKTIILKDGDTLTGKGQLVRYENYLYRRSDGKLLGSAISYSRRGGDLLIFSQPSSKHCAGYGSLESIFFKR